MAGVLVIAFFGSGASGGQSERGVASGDGAVVAPDRSPAPRSECRSARLATVHYRALTWARQRAREAELSDRTPIVSGKSCRWARYAAGEHRARARSARLALERHIRRLANPTYAICHVFGRYCAEALRVASCESGRGIHARNGQYLGMFQMGSSERAIFGHSATAIGQARSAFSYFAASGYDWSPWECKP